MELDCIDITGEVSTISLYIYLPCEGYLEKVSYMFAYLKHKHNISLILDPAYPLIEYRKFPLNDWSKFYREPKEIRTDNAPDPRGKVLLLSHIWMHTLRETGLLYHQE